MFLYSGTLALKHNPDWLWALAEAFRDDPEVVVVLAAAGVSYDALKLRAASERQPNLMFLPLQPAADLPDLLATADVTIGLLENDAGEFSVPSKVLSYLCAGRPILLAAPQAIWRRAWSTRAEAGLVVSATTRRPSWPRRVGCARTATCATIRPVRPRLRRDDLRDRGGRRSVRGGVRGGARPRKWRRLQAESACTL